MFWFLLVEVFCACRQHRFTPTQVCGTWLRCAAGGRVGAATNVPSPPTICVPRSGQPPQRRCLSRKFLTRETASSVATLSCRSVRLQRPGISEDVQAIGIERHCCLKRCWRGARLIVVDRGQCRPGAMRPTEDSDPVAANKRKRARYALAAYASLARMLALNWLGSAQITWKALCDAVDVPDTVGYNKVVPATIYSREQNFLFRLKPEWQLSIAGYFR